jgi:hypothetical protein
MMSNYILTDLEIEALIDEELGSSEAELIWAAINHTPTARQRFEELYRQKCLLQKWASFKDDPRNQI